MIATDKQREVRERELSREMVKSSAMWKCERCGRQCRRPWEKFDSSERSLVVCDETIDHVPIALCVPCYMRDVLGEAMSKRKGKKNAKKR